MCWFEDIPEVEILKTIGLYLSHSKHDGYFNNGTRLSSNVIVVSAGYDLAATIVGKSLEKEGAWNRLFSWVAAAYKPSSRTMAGERLHYVISLIEACSALREDHPLHFSNLVPTITTHAASNILNSSKNDICMSCNCDILDVLCSRGFEKPVVQTLIELCNSFVEERESFENILMNFPDVGRGLKSFVTELLYQVSKLNINDLDNNYSIHRVMIMAKFIPTVLWNENRYVRLQLGDVLITKGHLDNDSMKLLIDYLEYLSSDTTILEDALIVSLERAVITWGAQESVNRLHLNHQKVLANFIVNSLQLISKTRLEARDNLIPSILKGISLYLDSPREILRHIGMCIGNALSRTISPEQPVIFSEEGIDASIHLGHTTLNIMKDNNQSKKIIVENRTNDVLEFDSDDETDSEFGCQENLDELDESEPEKLLQLQEVVKMLNAPDDRWKDQLDAIALSKDLIKASPCELELYAEPLAKGLIYTRLPVWANEEIEGSNMKPFDDQRMDALLALVMASPQKAGSCLIDVFYSPSSNVEHRTKSLQVLSTGAKAISSKYLSHRKGESQQQAQHQLNEKVDLSRILLDWSAKLLSHCDRPQHGIDLFGKDTYLLGCLLCTLGNFLETLSGSQEALFLGTAVLKLVETRDVRSNAETFVRRAALAAAAQSFTSVPSSSICTVVAEKLVGTSDGPLVGQHIAATMKEFVKLMDVMSTWFEDVYTNDIDSTCQKLGQGGLRLIEILTMDALNEYSKQIRESGSAHGTIEMRSLEHLKSHEQSISLHIPTTTIQIE